MVGDRLVEGVLPVPTARDSARHEEVDVVGELFAVNGVWREEDGCPAALRVVHCFLCIAGHCFRFLSVNDCCLDEVREGDLLDGDGFVVHVCVVGGRLSRFVAAGVRLVETVMIVRVCGGRWGWWHEWRIVRERWACFRVGCCLAALVVAVRRTGVVFCVLVAHAHGGTRWGELGDGGSVALVADCCVPRVVDVVADGDHDVCGCFGCERGC